MDNYMHMLLFKNGCVYVCVCEGGIWCIHAQLCVPVSMHADARGECLMYSFMDLSLTPLRQELSLNLKFDILIRLFVQWVLNNHPYLPIKARVASMYIHSGIFFFMWVLNIWTQVLMLVQDHSYSPSYLMSHCIPPLKLGCTTDGLRRGAQMI